MFSAIFSLCGADNREIGLGLKSTLLTHPITDRSHLGDRPTFLWTNLAQRRVEEFFLCFVGGFRSEAVTGHRLQQ
jgi:hypothetical protein